MMISHNPNLYCVESNVGISVPTRPRGFSTTILETRYARLFWVDNRTTQRVLVGALNPSLERVLLPLLPPLMTTRHTWQRFAN